jgi:predicted unusual protein kinase regulating ubiquinone biosynthesis (AarF/ABC1/UbiB family)
MIFDAQRRFGLVGSNAFALTILAIITFEGVLKELDPELDFQNEALRFLLKSGGVTMPRNDRICLYAALREEVHKKFQVAAWIMRDEAQ